MRSQTYVYTFVFFMTVIVAIVLAGMNTALKDVHAKNEAIYNRKAILASIQDQLDIQPTKMKTAEIEKLFNDHITQTVIDHKGNVIEGVKAEELDLKAEKKKSLEERRLPFYIYDDGDKRFTIVYARGNGLWDEVWGNIALEEDLSTIAGTSFDHTGETPGLGAEIKDNPNFAKQFQGKEIFDDNGNFTSVAVVKGALKNPDHQVDAISGATITCVGVSDMLYEGIELYLPYLKKLDK